MTGGASLNLAKCLFPAQYLPLGNHRSYMTNLE